MSSDGTVHGEFWWEVQKGGKITRKDADEIAAFSFGQQDVPVGKFLVVNDFGSFFNKTTRTGGTFVYDGHGEYGGDNPQSRAATLLHELGHQIMGPEFLKQTPNASAIQFLHDVPKNDSDVGNQNKNTARLEQFCGALIRTYPK